MPNGMEEAGVQAVIRGLGDFKAGAQEMDRAISTASQGMSSALQTVSQKMQDVGASVTSLGEDLSMKLTAPLVALGTLAVTSAMAFGGAMREMGFAIPDVEAFGASIDELTAYTLKLGREGPFGPDQVAGAITRLIKAGWDWKQIQEMMPAITDLAIAKDLDLAKSADIVSVALNTFGLNTDQARTVVDSFVQSTNVSLATTDDMAQALTDMGPIAKTFGWSLEDVNTMLAILSSRGMDGSSAVMAMRTMFARLLAPGDEAKQMLAALNIQLYDAQGNVKPLPALWDELSRALGEGATQTVAVGGATKEMTEDYQKAVENIDEVRGKMIGLEAQWGPTGMTYQFLKDMQAQGRLAENLVSSESRAIWDAGQKLDAYEAAIRAYEQAQGTATTATSTLTEAQKIQIAETLFGARGMKALSIIVDEGGVGFEELGARARETASAEEEARAKSESFGGQIKQLRASLYSLLVEVGTPILKDFLLPFIHKVVELVQKFQGLDKGTARIIVIIAGLAAAIGPVLVVVGTLISSLGSVMAFFGGGGAIGALGAAIGGLVVPIALVVGAIVLLAKAWMENWGGIRDKVMEVIEQIQPILQRLMDGIEALFSGDIQKAIGDFAFAIADVFGADVGAAFFNFFEQVRAIVPEIIAWFQEQIPAALAYLQGIWNEVWPTIQSIVTTVLGTVVGVIMTAWTTIRTWTEANWPTIQAAIQTVLEWIGSFVNLTIANVVAIFQSAWTIIREWTDENWPLIQATIETILTTIMNIVSWICAAITAFWDRWGQDLLAIAQTAWDIIRTAIETVINAILGIIKVVMLLIQGDWKGAWEEVKTVATTIWDGIKTMVNLALGKIVEKIIEAKDRFVEAGKDLMRGVLDGMKEMKDRIIDWIEGLCRKIWQSIVDFFKSGGSPSELMAGVGRDVMGGFLKGLEQMRPALDAQMRMILAPTMQVAAPAMAGGGGGTTIYNYQYQVGPLTANYAQVQSPASILDDLTALQMLAGARG